jgi:hypothetical protein
MSRLKEKWNAVYGCHFLVYSLSGKAGKVFAFDPGKENAWSCACLDIVLPMCIKRFQAATEAGRHALPGSVYPIRFRRFHPNYSFVLEPTFP